MEVLYRLLLISIGLFMTGLLYQLRNLADSFEGRATILLITWELGVVLASGIVMMMLGTTYHAVRHEACVFHGLVSKVIVGDVEIGVGVGLRSVWLWIRAACTNVWGWFKSRV